MKNFYKLTTALLSVSAMSLFAGNAFAAGTVAGTSVANEFTLNYQVSGIDQTEINNSGDPTTFLVDRKIDLTVTSSGNQTVIPGDTTVTFNFKVQNDSNDTVAYNFALTDSSGNTFALTNVVASYYSDGNSNGTLETGSDTEVMTSYNGTDASIDVDMDDFMFVSYTATIPASAADDQVYGVSLVATSVGADGETNANGVFVVNSDGNGVNNLDFIENILSDGSGSSHETANDGKHSATVILTADSPNLTGSKAVVVLNEDGAGCSTMSSTPASSEEYSVPGACIEYTITVANNGDTVTATNIAVLDELPAGLTYISTVHSGFEATPVPTIVTLAANTNCAAGACDAGVTGASLDTGEMGTVKIRAIIN